MGFSRSVLLWMSENTWMKNHVPNWWFVKKAINKFMPGETEEAALNTAVLYEKENIANVFTKLGENIFNLSDAEKVRDHYLQLIEKIAERKLHVEISIKLTQLGFDISVDSAFDYCRQIADKVKEKLNNTLFIDMEGSAYTQTTIDFYKKLKKKCSNVGLCLQAYLFRTENDIDELLALDSSIRLVKGAYRESTEIVIAKKADVDKNYLKLAKRMMMIIQERNSRIIFATHDETLIYEIIRASKFTGLKKSQVEFQMLYGIKTDYLKNLAMRGYNVKVLIAYGLSWYPWYMRRLAERPANIWFVLKNIF